MTDTERERINAICEVAGVADIDDLSDGFHTFRQLYYQRMMLFAVIVKQNKDRAWKSLRHEDGELCFGGGWFIVGIDTPEGSYTYHYEDNYYSLFDCEELERGKHWDGHTEKDVTRLLSLQKAQLSQEGTTKDATSDTISRQAAVELAMKYCPDDDGTVQCDGDIRGLLDELENLPSAQPEPKWIPCRERMPECEQEVLICTMEKVYVSRKTGREWYEEPIITPALYEDGTMLEVNSKWRWEDIDYAGWDEEEDCGIIPEGWWENRHFNQDDVYNNVVDKKVIAWMPLPEPYKGGTE